MKQRPSSCYTICYALDFHRGDDDGPFTATWFAYGSSKENAKKAFLADFNTHREDFYGADKDTDIYIVNVVKGCSF